MEEPDTDGVARGADPDVALAYRFEPGRCRSVIALREDYLPQLEQFADADPSVIRNRYAGLCAMSGAESAGVVPSRARGYRRRGGREDCALSCAAGEEGETGRRLQTWRWTRRC